MAEINRYDQPIHGQAMDTFVDTYVPIPFDEMMKVGMMKKEQEDKVYDMLSKTYEDSHNIKYAPNTKDEKYIKESVIPATKEIFEKYANQELSNPIIQRQLRSELNSKIDKNRIDKIQETYQGWREHELQKQKLATEDKLNPYEEDKISGWDSSSQGVYHGMSTAYIDPIKEIREDLFKPIHDSTLKRTSLGAGNIRITSGVDDKTVSKVSNDNLGNYINKLNVRTKIRQVREAYGISPDKMNDAEILYHYIFKPAADPYLRENEKIEHLQRDKNKDNKTSPFLDAWSNTQSIKNMDRVNISKDQIGHDLTEATDPIKLMKSGNFDDNGNLIKRTAIPGPDRSGNISVGKSGSFLDMYLHNQTTQSGLVNPSAGSSINQEQLDKQYNNQRNLIDHIKSTSYNIDKDGKPIYTFKNLPDMEVLRAYSQAYNNLENVDYNEYLFDNFGKGNIKKPITDMIIDDLGGRKLVNAQTGKHSGETINNLNDIFDKLDVPKDDRKRSNIHITGTVPGKNAYKATIFSSDGKSHDFLISTNQKEQYIFKPIEDVVKLANNGIVGDKELNVGGRRFIVRSKIVSQNENGYPMLDNNGQPTHKFKSVITSGDRMPVLKGQDPNAEIPLNVLEWESVQQLTHPYTQQALNNAGQQEQESTESEE